MFRNQIIKLVSLIILVSSLTAFITPFGHISQDPSSNTNQIIPNNQPAENTSSSAVTTSHLAGLAMNFGQLPLYFVENRGQMDARIAYYVLGGSTQIYFSDDGISIMFRKSEATNTLALASDPRQNRDSRSARIDMTRDPSFRKEPVANIENRWIVKLDFVNADPVQPAGRAQSSAIVSYFSGSPDEWQSALPTYGQIVYTNLWPGIDLIYSGQAGQLKYEFFVRPGADPNQIRLQYRGASQVSLSANGEIEVTTPLGGFTDGSPLAWQTEDGGHSMVKVAYEFEGIPSSSLPGETEIGGQFGFNVGAYDRAKPLLIDPVVLVYCGYIGGVSIDGGWEIALDEAGNTYITGETSSTEATFPVSVGPDQSHNGQSDAFVVKVNPTGTGLIYAGYIGGAANDYSKGIAVDDSGNAYITGETTSDQNTFPVVVGPDLIANGVSDAFVAKINAAGTALVYAGYIGGGAWDKGFGIAVDGNDNAYVTGSAGSDQNSFPVRGGPDLTFNNVEDAFIAKITPEGDSLIYCGYIGGSQWDLGREIAIDAAGNAFVSGETNSTESSFPVIIGPDLTFNGGERDAFVAQVSASGAALVYAGYIGGSGKDIGLGIELDGAGNAYITGETGSNETSFPVVVGPDLTYNGGPNDAFITRVISTGLSLDFAGYIGGSSDDVGWDVGLDGMGNAYVVGETASPQPSFPVRLGPDLTYNGGSRDAFITKISANGMQLIYSGFIGGANTDYGIGIAVDFNGNAYITGITSSLENSFPVTGGPDLSYNGGSWDAFVAKVSVIWLYYMPLMINDP
jgi:hypothetical protein